MTEVLIDLAEEMFLANEIIEAYRTAKMARKLDPFFGSVESYEAAFRVHAAAILRSPEGEPDWYNILGIDDFYVPDERIAHRFCRLGKLINPDNHVSAAAPQAYRLASQAFEVLGDPKSRAAFHRRWRLLPPPAKKEVGIPAQVMSRGCASRRLPKSHASTLRRTIT